MPTLHRRTFQVIYLPVSKARSPSLPRQRRYSTPIRNLRHNLPTSPQTYLRRLLEILQKQQPRPTPCKPARAHCSIQSTIRPSRSRRLPAPVLSFYLGSHISVPANSTPQSFESGRHGTPGCKAFSVQGSSRQDIRNSVP